MFLLKLLLLILKIIGITLLVILGLILLIVLIICFVPVRYKVNASYYDKLKVNAKITYILGIIKVTFNLDGKESDFKLKIFGKEKKKRKGATKENDNDSIHNDVDSDVSEGYNPILAEENQIESIPLEDKEDKNDNAVDEVKDVKDVKEVIPDEKEKTKDKKKKVKEKKTKSKNKDKISNKQSIFDKIKILVNTLKSNKKVIRFVFKKLKKLLKHILPGSHVINLRLGLDDPATLGEIVGAVSVVRAATNLTINFVPDFNNKVIEGDIKFKGKLRLGTVIFIALSVYLNKGVKKLIKELKN